MCIRDRSKGGDTRELQRRMVPPQKTGSSHLNSAQFPSPMGQFEFKFEFAREIDLLVVEPNCSLGLFLLHDVATLALTVFLLFSDSLGLPSKQWFLKKLLAG